MFDPENHQANLIQRHKEIIDKDEDEERRGGEENGKTENNMTLKERNSEDIADTEHL